MNNLDNLENEIVTDTFFSQEALLLEQIHTDLGIITSFVALVVVFALFYFIYKAIYNLFNV